MKVTNIFHEVKDGRRRMKPTVVMMGVVSAFVLFVFIVLLMQNRAEQNRRKAGPFANRPAQPQRDLDYQIVRVDTIPVSNLAVPSSNAPAMLSPDPLARSTSPTAGLSETEKNPALGGSGTPARNTGNNMIVVSTLDQKQAGGSITSMGGLQSVRLKVLLPQKTPVMNGSLLEARVMKDDRLGKIDIPRRTQLLGLCTLQNNRVQVEFRELRIKDVTYTCTGRAYDLKFLPGLGYLPLDAKAKQLLLDELKSATASVPIVGRYLNQTEVNPFTDEITSLDEGMEFYAVINSVF